MQRRIAKLDEKGTAAKGTYKCTFSIPAALFLFDVDTCSTGSGSATLAVRVTIF
jgi:hypothetical protein